MVSEYRLAPPYVARVAGSALVLVALAIFAGALVGAVAHWSLAVVVGIGVVGLLAAVIAAGWVSRVPVVRFDDEGYRIRLVRGAGVHAARWADVHEVVPATAGATRCVVLRLSEDRTTTIPLDPLAAQTEAFVEDLRSRLRHGHGIRPLGG